MQRMGLDTLQEDIPKMLEYMLQKDLDLVCGWRKKRKVTRPSCILPDNRGHPAIIIQSPVSTTNTSTTVI